MALNATDERREHTRLSGADLPDTLVARIRPGYQTRIIDLARSGVLIECGRRLLPGTSVELIVERDPARHATRARVVRCYVHLVLPTGLIYRCGLRLDSAIAWLAEPATDRGR
ncbi:MAG: PilZ domain-containing protein [Vicinamibacterales bacterium]